MPGGRAELTVQLGFELSRSLQHLRRLRSRKDPAAPRLSLRQALKPLQIAISQALVSRLTHSERWLRPCGRHAMRITSWNCRYPKSVDRCLALLAMLGSDADLVALQECRLPDGANTSVIWKRIDKVGVTTQASLHKGPDGESRSVIWRGSDPQFGSAVVSKPRSLWLESIRIPSLHHTVVPVVIHAPHPFKPFVFIGFWNSPKKKNGKKKSFRLTAWKAMNACATKVDGRPIVAAGDFNVSPRVKTQGCAANKQFRDPMCDTLGLVIAYDHVDGEMAGLEKRATYYHVKKKFQPFHLDYCFVPKGWLKLLVGVKVEPFEAFQMSDHRPLTVGLVARHLP